MSKMESILRYNLIVNKLESNPSSFEEISKYLDNQSKIQGYDFRVSIRTFQRDIKDIYNLYRIKIKFNVRKKVYEVNEKNITDFSERLIELNELINTINIYSRFASYIKFEKRKSTATEHFISFLNAAKKNKFVLFSYTKIDDSVSSERKIAPYFLKEFGYAWYIVGKDAKDDFVKSFALDRISNLRVLKEKFEYPNDSDHEEKFKHAFGIISNYPNPPEEVILQFKPKYGKYIKLAPIHHSQEIIIDNEQELRIKLNIYLTIDFIRLLLSKGNDVIVLKPASLSNELKRIYTEALNNL